MSSANIVLIVIAIIVVLAIIGVVFARPQLERQRLRMRFGPEYDHAMHDNHSRHEAERALLARERRHKQLRLRPLAPATREHYREEWEAVQERFVDNPGGAAAEAERLITSIMTDQGYPDEGHEQRLADLSVGHTRATDHYRQAHQIGSRSTRDAASTEELRQALVHYRTIFDELLSAPKTAPGIRGRVARAGHRDDRETAERNR
jgi:hypothetical protein